MVNRRLRGIKQLSRVCVITVLLSTLWLSTAKAISADEILNKQQILSAQTFWDNQDWDWYIQNIPFLETPDPVIDTTYYYRWELVTKHLTYGSPRSGYSLTEFIDRPFWSGTYGAISCPAGHQLYEVRWLHDKRYAQDYARYWFRTPGAEPRRYSTWLADSVWAIQIVQDDEAFAIDLLPDLINNFTEWERRNFVPEMGLFWQTGHDDGMEFNISSRQTQDIVRGAPGYRPSTNAYLYGDAVAIAKIARLADKPNVVANYEKKATDLQRHVQESLWDPRRQFFFPMFKNDEQRDGYQVEAGSLTYETGQFAGSEHGRELIGYVPWQFNMPELGRGYETAWKFLMDDEFFRADYGPTVTERHDPLFSVTDHCCWWSGQSWPYATTQTLVAMANLLNHYQQDIVTKQDYFQLLQTYAKTHRKNGVPYLAEAANPDTGSWEGYDSYNHSEHYFHSAYCDLIVTGLIGLRPRGDNVVEINPLAPEDWDYFAMTDISYRGHLVSVIWDRSGQRYGQGKGLRLIVDGSTLAARDDLGRLSTELPHDVAAPLTETPRLYNFAVNNDGTYYPRMTASFHNSKYSPLAAQDGNYWYHASPPNRWTTEGSDQDVHWLAVDFGTERELHEVVCYFLDDGPTLQPPATVAVQVFHDGQWQAIEDVRMRPHSPTGRRANHWTFDPVTTQRLRVLMTASPGVALGLSELETWGPQRTGSLDPPKRPASLATNQGGDYPKVSASHTSRFDRVEFANDGVINYRPSPHNRWTAYESKADADWLEVDFGKPTQFARVDLHIYDDRGGVQPPAKYVVQFWDDDHWQDVLNAKMSPQEPAGGTVNTATFDSVTSRRVRVVFHHDGTSRSGLTEIDIWER